MNINNKKDPRQKQLCCEIIQDEIQNLQLYNNLSSLYLFLHSIEDNITILRCIFSLSMLFMLSYIKTKNVK